MHQTYLPCSWFSCCFIFRNVLWNRVIQCIPYYYRRPLNTFLLFSCSFSIGLRKMQSTLSHCTASTRDIMWEHTTTTYQRLGLSACASYCRVSGTWETHYSTRAGDWLFTYACIYIFFHFVFLLLHLQCLLSPHYRSNVVWRNHYLFIGNIYHIMLCHTHFRENSDRCDRIRKHLHLNEVVFTHSTVLIIFFSI